VSQNNSGIPALVCVYSGVDGDSVGESNKQNFKQKEKEK
jgi:hypothetical protein